MNEPKQPGFVPGQFVIEGYGGGGFRFADMSHRGSILALPSGVHAWAPMQAGEVDVQSLAPLFNEPAGAVELLLFGSGQTLNRLPKSVGEALRAAGVRVEPMATGAAMSTYNLLLEERRRVAAALIAVP